MPSMLELGAIALTPAARRRKIYDLALQLGSPPEEAQSLSTNPDAMQFLDAKLTRMRAEKKFPEGTGLPPSRIPPFTEKDILPKSIQYSLGLSDMEPKFEPAQAPVSQAPAPTPPVPADMFVGPQLPPSRVGGLTAGLSDLPPGGFTPPGQDRFDRTARAAKDKEAGDKRRMLLSLAEGLTRAGATASNVRGLSDILAGQARRPTDQSTADMLAKVRELSEERDAKKLEDAKNPIVDMYNKMKGTSFTTPEEVRQHQGVRATEAEIGAAEGQTLARKEATEIKKAETLAEKTAEAERLLLLQKGELSGLNDKQKTDIEDRRQKFLDNTKGLRENLISADRGIKMAEDADVNGMRYYANAVLVARAQGEVGNLSQTEQEIYRNLPGLEGRAMAIQDWLTSQISQGRIDAITDILQEIKDNVTVRLTDAAEGETSAFTQLTPEAAPEAVRRYMVAGMPIEISDPGKQKVEMITPEGEILEVEAQDVDSAKRELGWEVRGK